MAHKLSKVTIQQAVEACHLAPNEQVSINHEDCPAGEDTRKRLYLKRTEDGSRMLLHCFNCGGSGSWKVGLQRGIVEPPMPSVSAAKLVAWGVALDNYKGAERISLGYGDHTDVWPCKYFSARDEIDWMREHDWYGLRYLPTVDTFMLPRGSTGFDYRTVDKQMWRSTKPGHEKDSKVLIYNSSNSKKAVIVEDALSAMKVDMGGFAGVALCGSSLSADDAFKLSMMYDRFVVWLDNDNKEVVKNAELAQHRLLLYTKDVGLVHDMPDPKNYIWLDVKQAIEET